MSISIQSIIHTYLTAIKVSSGSKNVNPTFFLTFILYQPLKGFANHVVAHQMKEKKENEAAEKEQARKRKRREMEQKETDKEVKQEIQRGVELNPNIIPMPGRLEWVIFDLTNEEDIDGPTARWQNRYVF